MIAFYGFMAWLLWLVTGVVATIGCGCLLVFTILLYSTLLDGEEGGCGVDTTHTTTPTP